jgi:hypothetical protein
LPAKQGIYPLTQNYPNTETKLPNQKLTTYERIIKRNKTKEKATRTRQTKSEIFVDPNFSYQLEYQKCSGSHTSYKKIKKCKQYIISITSK